MKPDGELVLVAKTKSQSRHTPPRPTVSSVLTHDLTVKEGVQMSKVAHREPTQISMRALAKIMTSAEELNLSCIGISGITQSCGASQIAHGLARAFSDFGRSALLVIVSDQGDDASPTHIETIDERLGVIKLTERQLSAATSPLKLCEAIGELSEPYPQIVVDLPALYLNDSQFNIRLKEIGSLCDATYLVCETAGHSRATLANAVDFCQLSKIDLAGWILNDQKLKFQNLISDQ